jgi:hypothetical protein
MQLNGLKIHDLFDRLSVFNCRDEVLKTDKLGRHANIMTKLA